MTEMAFDSGVHDKDSFSGISDWEYYQKNPGFVKLINDKLGSNRYKVYKTKTKTNFSYFLVSKNEEYLGKIQVLKNKTGIKILTSNGKVKGFYQIMFTIILKEYNEIQSDTSLSTQAIKSYEKLSKRYSIFDVYVKAGSDYFKFSKDKLLENPSNIVAIKISNKDFIKEHLEEYYKRIQQNDGPLPSTFKRMFQESNESLDQWLFGSLTQEKD